MKKLHVSPVLYHPETLPLILLRFNQSKFQTFRCSPNHLQAGKNFVVFGIQIFVNLIHLNYHMSNIVIIQNHIIVQSNWHLQSGCILKQDNPGIVKNCLPKQLWLSPKLQQKSQLSPTRMSIITSSKYCLRYQLLHRKLLNHKGNQTCYHLIIHQSF